MADNMEKIEAVEDKAVEIADEVKDKASDLAEDAGDVAEDIKDKAADIAEDVKERAVDLKEDAGELAEKAEAAAHNATADVDDMPKNGTYIALTVVGFIFGILWGVLDIVYYNKMKTAKTEGNHDEAWAHAKKIQIFTLIGVVLNVVILLFMR